MFERGATSAGPVELPIKQRAGSQSPRKLRLAVVCMVVGGALAANVIVSEWFWLKDNGGSGFRIGPRIAERCWAPSIQATPRCEQTTLGVLGRRGDYSLLIADAGRPDGFRSEPAFMNAEVNVWRSFATSAKLVFAATVAAGVLLAVLGLSCALAARGRFLRVTALTSFGVTIAAAVMAARFAMQVSENAAFPSGAWTLGLYVFLGLLIAGQTCAILAWRAPRS